MVASGTRGTDGLVFDRRWDLFSNDNDHESLADRYSPARLLHVAPRANFFWPRGWIASMSPERSDLLEVVYAGLGREAPVGIAYYDEPLLGERYRDSLLLACWGQRKIAGFKLAPRGASYQASEFPLLNGSENARPVGVTVGRDGRVFAAISYMPGNEGSPKYSSELVMITTANDPPTSPYEPYDVTRAEGRRLWAELSRDSTVRRQQAHAEILRRGSDLLVEAVRRLQTTDDRDPAMQHLPWLAAASGRPEAREALVALAAHRDPQLRATAIRALAEFRELAAPADVFAKALADQDAQRGACRRGRAVRSPGTANGWVVHRACARRRHLSAPGQRAPDRGPGHGEPARCAACFQRCQATAGRSLSRRLSLDRARRHSRSAGRTALALRVGQRALHDRLRRRED